jgi:hypothetical protein
MRTALVTPFLSHLPLHPGSYLGYGAALLKKQYELDVIDINASIYYKYIDQLQEILSDIDQTQVVLDNFLLDPFYLQLLDDLEKEVKKISWSDYQSIYITTPSWFVTVPTQEILKLARLIKKESPQSQIFFFGNSLGSWTNKKELIKHDINIRHLNDLFQELPVNEPVNFDSLPTPLYENRDKYLFDMLPFRLKHGCIWGKCKFCSLAKGWNSGYLERESEKVIEELTILSDTYNPQMFVCRDNSINGANLLEFCSHFKNLKKPWAGMARADLSDKEIDSLQESGCRFIYFGLESGSDWVLNENNKGINSKQMSRFIRALYDHHIMPAPSIFVGSPAETEDEFKKSAKFIDDHKNYLDIINLYPYMSSPASDFSLMEKKGHENTLTRLKKMISVCVDAGLKVCVGEQSAEYVLFKTVCHARDTEAPIK